MTLKSRIASALAAIVLMPLTPAYAADYDPPIYVDQAPDYVPVEVGSGWYLRGDVGYAFSDPFEHQDNVIWPARQLHQRAGACFTGSIGMGYHFNDYLRVELNGGILPTNKFGEHAKLAATCNGHDARGPTAGNHQFGRRYTAVRSLDNASNKGYSVMANGYVDLGTYVGITPYVGGGLGIAYTKYYKSIGARDCVEVPQIPPEPAASCDDPAGYEGTTIQKPNTISPTRSAPACPTR